MNATRNPGRVAGLWYVLLILLGPVRLMYIAHKLLVLTDPAATVRNIADHEWLFRVGMVTELAAAVVLIYLTLAMYRLVAGVDRYLAAQVVLFGGVMTGTLTLVNVMFDAGALMIVRGADFLSVFNKPQQDALVILLLRMHNHLTTADEILWGMWLFPMAALVYRSRFLPRFLGVWLALNGVAYVALSLSGTLVPQYQGRLFLWLQPALFGELALTLWLVIKGARPRGLGEEA